MTREQFHLEFPIGTMWRAIDGTHFVVTGGFPEVIAPLDWRGHIAAPGVMRLHSYASTLPVNGIARSPLTAPATPNIDAAFIAKKASYQVHFVWFKISVLFRPFGVAALFGCRDD